MIRQHLSGVELSMVRFAATIWCLCTITACNRPPDYYYPLGGGKYWRYTMTYHTMDGNFKGIYAVENIGHGAGALHNIYVRRLLDGSSEFLSVEDTGIRLVSREKKINGQTSRVDMGHYVFSFPLAIGTKWQDTTISRALIKTGPPQKTEFHIRAKVPVTATINSLTDYVSVTAGSFANCMRITLKGDAFTNAGNYVGLTIITIDETNWYAPGVGLVKSIRKESTTSRALDQGEIILELESYRH